MSKNEKAEIRKQKLLAQYAELQLQKEAHIQQIQIINDNQNKVKIELSKVKI